MRIASLLAPLALAAFVQLPLQAQRADSAMVGRWSGLVVLTVPFTQQHELTLQIDVRGDGVVAGTLGDALIVDAHLYRESRLAQVLHFGRQYAIDGRLFGPVIRRESVSRELVRLSLDRAGTHLAGSLRTSGAYEGEPGDPMLTGIVSLDRATSPVALGALPPVPLRGASNAAVRQPSP